MAKNHHALLQHPECPAAHLPGHHGQGIRVQQHCLDAPHRALSGKASRENLRKTTWWEKGFYSSLPGAAEFIEVQSLLLTPQVSLGSL